MSNWQRWKGIQKAVPFEEKRLAKWSPPYIVQPKLDGIRCRAVPVNDAYILLSSEENIIYSVPHINTALNDRDLKAELDGELYLHGMSFENILSITKRTVNLHSQYDMMQFHIFDQIVSGSQMERTMYISEFEVKPPLVIVPFYICESLDDIMRTYDKILEDDYEGIIVRNINAPYERKRSIWMMKFKPKKEDNYAIIGYTEEISIEGIAKGRLGALVCRSGDGNTFSVGTGFTRQQRTDLWERRSSLQGSTAKVQYQHLTSGKKVPRFPVFVEVIDGQEPNK